MKGEGQKFEKEKTQMIIDYEDLASALGLERGIIYSLNPLDCVDSKSISGQKGEGLQEELLILSCSLLGYHSSIP